MKPFFDQILKNISEIFKSIIPKAKKDNKYKFILIFIILAFFAISYFIWSSILFISIWIWDYCVFLFNDDFSNKSLPIMGILGLALGTWRSLIAEKQWRTAEEGQQTDRYQKASQMLASENETERIGAIYALRDLVLANAEVYYITVMDLFCTFLRRPWYEAAKDNLVKKLEEELKQKNDVITNEDIDEEDKQAKFEKNREEYIKKLKEAYPSFPADRQLICEIAFATLRDFETYPDHQKIEKKWRPYLEKAELFNLNAPTNAKLDDYNFANINAKQANFSLANCEGANFSEAECKEADFSGADCQKANFSDSHCGYANFSGADCQRTNFSGSFIEATDFSQSKNLFQSQIENAYVIGSCPDDCLPKIPDAWKRNTRDIILFLDPKLKYEYDYTSKIERKKIINNNAKKWNEWDEDRKLWLGRSWKKDKK